MPIKIEFVKENDAKGIIDMDVEVYGPDDMVDEATVRDWISVNPYHGFVAKDENGLVLGAIGLYHIKKESFDKIIGGEITEQNLTKEDILPFKEGNIVNCYLSITVRKENSRVAVLLLSKVVWYFKFLAEHNIDVDKICAIGYTDKGIKLCEKLGMKKVREYEPLPSGRMTALYVKDLKEDSASRFAKTVKGILLENNEAI